VSEIAPTRNDGLRFEPFVAGVWHAGKTTCLVTLYDRWIVIAWHSAGFEHIGENGTQSDSWRVVDVELERNGPGGAALHNPQALQAPWVINRVTTQGDTSELATALEQRRSAGLTPWGLVWANTIESEIQARDAFERIYGPRGLTFDSFMASTANGTDVAGVRPRPADYGPLLDPQNRTWADVVLRDEEGWIPVLAWGLADTVLTIPCWDTGDGSESLTSGDPPCTDEATVLCSFGAFCGRHWRLLKATPFWHEEGGMSVDVHLARDETGRWTDEGTFYESIRSGPRDIAEH
jgi:hypothetical protein